MLPYTDEDLHRPRVPPITLALIALTTLTFLLQLQIAGLALFSGEINIATARLFLQWGFTPETAGDPAELPTLLTYTLFHVSFLHLAGNLLFLWTFGPTIEGRAGPIRYLALYAGAAAGAALLHAAIAPQSPQPLVGASGAVSAIIAAYAVICPGHRITLLAPPPFQARLQIPALLIIGVWVALQAAQTIAHPPSADASWAHLGGIITGAVPATIARYQAR